jgi:eukaryotic-like serine/threonine-protein kinase
MREFVRTRDGQPLRGEKLLGVGGQGEVWQAQMDGSAVAVKIYHPHTTTSEQRAVLERLVQKGRPAKYFLWPIELIEDPTQPSMGYVMELREKRFRALEDFLTRRIEPSLRALLTASWQLADAFLSLHSAGFCYRDISFANVFFDPANGDVRICDNDNVEITGAQTGGVLGTPRFMAPEVVRREAPPSANTDRYSLAVLLFFMLMGGHPLDGEREASIRCLDVPALEQLYGFKPLYIFHPDDTSNRPRPGLHDNVIAFQHLYPAPIREAFLRSFTEGLDFPVRRVRESEWRKAFGRAIDSILPCAKCGAESFYDPDLLRNQGSMTCWSCKGKLTLPPRIRIGDEVVMLNRDTRLFGYHIGVLGDDAGPIAEVAANPTNPGLFGLRNLTTGPWTLTRPDGTIVDVPPGRAAAIVSGNKLNFGLVTGEIRA